MLYGSTGNNDAAAWHSFLEPKTYTRLQERYPCWWRKKYGRHGSSTLNATICNMFTRGPPIVPLYYDINRGRIVLHCDINRGRIVLHYDSNRGRIVLHCDSNQGRIVLHCDSNWGRIVLHCDSNQGRIVLYCYSNRGRVVPFVIGPWFECLHKITHTHTHIHTSLFFGYNRGLLWPISLSWQTGTLLHLW